MVWMRIVVVGDFVGVGGCVMHAGSFERGSGGFLSFFLVADKGQSDRVFRIFLAVIGWVIAVLDVPLQPAAILHLTHLTHLTIAMAHPRRRRRCLQTAIARGSAQIEEPDLFLASPVCSHGGGQHTSSKALKAD